MRVCGYEGVCVAGVRSVCVCVCVCVCEGACVQDMVCVGCG